MRKMFKRIESFEKILADITMLINIYFKHNKIILDSLESRIFKLEMLKPNDGDLNIEISMDKNTNEFQSNVKQLNSNKNIKQ